MFQFHPLVGALLAALATLAALTAASHACAAETYLGANIAARSNTDLNCIGGAACERPGNASGKIVGGYLSALAPLNGVEIAQGIEVMAYTAGSSKAVFRNANAFVPGSAKSKGIGVTHVLRASLGDFAITTRLGLGYTRGKLNYAAGGADSKSVVVPLVGLGVRYSLNRDWALNADWDRLPGKYNDQQKMVVNMFSIGLSYQF
ncbi:MAG: outer membrane beta-barrel protein [Pseudomonadota bacterium]